MGKTKIDWTEHTWNPFTGCTPVSEGCKNCYAKRIALSLKRRGIEKYKNGFAPTVHHDEIEDPLTWKKRRMVFVCSMSDVFHDAFLDNDIIRLFRVMNSSKNHTFQILTKRPDRLLAMVKDLRFGKNIWVGVTVESQENVSRMDLLRRVPAEVKFVSCEPLVSPIELDLTGINWLIAGGENGPDARVCKLDWLRSLRDQTAKAKIPFFLKQIGSKTDEKTKLEDVFNKNSLDGKIYKELPDVGGDNLTFGF